MKPTVVLDTPLDFRIHGNLTHTYASKLAHRFGRNRFGHCTAKIIVLGGHGTVTVGMAIENNGTGQSWDWSFDDTTRELHMCHSR